MLFNHCIHALVEEVKDTWCIQRKRFIEAILPEDFEDNGLLGRHKEKGVLTSGEAMVQGRIQMSGRSVLSEETQEAGVLLG